MKAKHGSRKREHSLNGKSEKTECSWQMKSKATSPKEICWVQPFIAANKTKQNRKLKTRRSKKNA
jgi:hypothetical protein